MSVDNPYYFYNNNNNNNSSNNNNSKSPKISAESSNKGGFSFFRRHRSKSKDESFSTDQLRINSSSTTTSSSGTAAVMRSTTLSSDLSLIGSSRSSLSSLGSNSGATCIQSFELQQSKNGFVDGGFVQNGRIYRERLMSCNESIVYNENDDVFIPSIKNLNSRTLPNSVTKIRRHSFNNSFNSSNISTATAAIPMRCGSLSHEVPKMIAPKPPPLSPLKLPNNVTSKSTVKSSRFQNEDHENEKNMDEILLITAKHSEGGILWANFLKTRFDKITKQRGRKPFNFLHFKIDEHSPSTDLKKKYSCTILQIVIICPAFLALPQSSLASQLSSIINEEKVLGILLEVSEDKIFEIPGGILPSFRKWKRCSVKDNDQSLIGNILGIATDILGRALCQRPPCQETNGGSIKSAGKIEAFTVVPRKVKIGQNKVLVLLNEPINKEDWIKITIEKSGENIEVDNFKKKNPYTLQFNIPESCMEISTMIEIRIYKNNVDLGSRPVKCESRLRELEQLLRSLDSPMEFMCHSLGIGASERDELDRHLLQSFQRNMPINFHLLAGPHEKHKMFLYNHTTSEEYPTLLHFGARWGLERLCMQLVECPGGDAACETKNYSGKTPADLAEQGSFHKLAKSLRSFSKMHEFTTMYHYFKGISDYNTNSNKVVIEPKTPKSVEMTRKDKIQNTKSECPKAEKHSKNFENDIVQSEYMEMSSGSEAESSHSVAGLAVTNLNYINIESSEEDCNLQSSKELIKEIDRVKIIEEPGVLTNHLQINEPPYYQSNEAYDANENVNVNTQESSSKNSDRFSEDCYNVLENCVKDTLSQENQNDYLQQSSKEKQERLMDEGNYLIQPSNRPIEKPEVNYMNLSIDSQLSFKAKDEDLHLRINFGGKPKQSPSATLKRTASDASKVNVDDELAEIMYDFKNNVLSIREVEQLVEKWKNRNDVKQSFKEKQEQIEKLREEYDRIQDQMKAKLKRSTPFERVKKLFSRSKTQKHTNSEETDTDTKSSVTSSSQRPISSLSLQSVSSSSSSSGRMSTGSVYSGTSFGDSGTHSDPEDRRNHTLTSICRIGSPGSLMDNYLIPPVPRPVVKPLSTSTSVGDNEKVLLTEQKHSDSDEHYILFPSNIPVFPNTNKQSSMHFHQQSHHNLVDSFCGLNTIIETKENPSDIVDVPIKLQTNSSKNELNLNEINDTCSTFKPQLNNANNNSELLENINRSDIKATDHMKKISDNETLESDKMRNSLAHNYMNL